MDLSVKTAPILMDLNAKIVSKNVKLVVMELHVIHVLAIHYFIRMIVLINVRISILQSVENANNAITHVILVNLINIDVLVA